MDVTLYNCSSNYLKQVEVKKNANVICCMLTSLVSLQQENVKKSEKLMKIVNIEEENLHIFWTRWGISMKFPGKMSLTIILKVPKN